MRVCSVGGPLSPPVIRGSRVFPPRCPQKMKQSISWRAHTADPSREGRARPWDQARAHPSEQAASGGLGGQPPPPLVETPSCQHHLRMEWADMQRMLAGCKIWQEINTVPAREPAPGPGQGWRGGAGFPSDAVKWPVHACERTVHSRGWRGPRK